MRWIRARDKAGRVLARPNQTPGLRQRYGLTREQVDWEVWAIAADGTRWRGAAAVNQVLLRLPGIWPWLARLYVLPPVRWLEAAGYRWVADNRGRLARWWSARPECDEDGVECD